MRRRLLTLATLAALVSFAAPAAAQDVAVDTTQSVGTALAFSVEPSFHFVNTMEPDSPGSSTSVLVGDGIGLGAAARGMLFPFAQPGGALGFGVQAGANYAQLFNAGAGLLVGTVGLRYVLGAPRVGYWFDVNGGYGIASDENVGGAPYVDVGIGWQFASAPTFMWGIAGRWSFFFPNEEYTTDTGSTENRNYSMLSLALVLEWGPPRWQEPAVTPIPLAQGPTPMPVQSQGPQPIYGQPAPVVQPGPGPTTGPAPVQPIPIGNPAQPNPSGPALYSNNATPTDQDGDGIGDDADSCPAYAEDMNNHQDNDGCPDADRDADGVPDVLDQCPNRPEDFDSVRDEDGCPD